MKPRNANRPRMNTLNKGYRVKKTISHDVSSQHDDTERKLYIFRAQARFHERSNRKSDPHHSLPSTSRNTESSRNPSDAPPEYKVESLPPKRTNNEESEPGKEDGVFIDRIKAAMERESLAVAARAKSQREKAGAKPTGEADKSASGHIMAITPRGSVEVEEAKIESRPPEKEKPIKFLDSLGRKFTFPFETCATWQGMKSLIKQAFVQIPVVEAHVGEGYYDLVGPNGDIILPQVWDSVIQPGWTITMHLWPIPEFSNKSDSPAQVDDIEKLGKRKVGKPQYLRGSSLSQAAKEGALDLLQSLLSEELG